MQIEASQVIWMTDDDVTNFNQLRISHQGWVTEQKANVIPSELSYHIG